MNFDFSQTQLINIVTVATFVVVAGLFLFFSRLIQRFRRDSIRQRLSRVTESDERSVRQQQMVEALAGQIPKTRMDNGRLDKELRQAGYYHPTARSDFQAIRGALVVLTLIITGVIAVVIGPERQTIALRVVIGGLVVAALCWALPRVYMVWLARRRVRRIRAALPDALDMINMCLTGGMPLFEALSHVSSELFFAHPDLAVELLIIRQQADLTSLDSAFQQFAARIDAPETTALANLIAEGQRLGTDLVETVREFADTMRLTRRQLADEQAGRVSVRLLFPIVLCLVPAAIIYMWGPAVTSVVDFFDTFESAPRQLLPP